MRLRKLLGIALLVLSLHVAAPNRVEADTSTCSANTIRAALSELLPLITVPPSDPDSALESRNRAMELGKLIAGCESWVQSSPNNMRLFRESVETFLELLIDKYA
jgi:hypothetical protein